MSKKYFIASSLGAALATGSDHRRLVERLTAMGHQITYDPTTEVTENNQLPHQAGAERLNEVSQNIIEGVGWADVVIILYPGGRTAHVALGIAFGIATITGNRPDCILISARGDHHDATPEACCFYHTSRITRYRSVDDFLRSMQADAANLAPHQQRMIDEEKDLSERYSKLRDFIASNPIFQSMSPEDQDLQRQQQDGMEIYLRALRARIQRFLNPEPETPAPAEPPLFEGDEN